MQDEKQEAKDQLVEILDERTQAEEEITELEKQIEEARSRAKEIEIENQNKADEIAAKQRRSYTSNLLTSTVTPSWNSAFIHTANELLLKKIQTAPE